MKTSIAPELSIKAIETIKHLVKEQRLALGVGPGAPLANDLEMILEKLEITLLELPIPSSHDKPQLSALLLYNKPYAFIGVNTADYYDKQIFAIAHELYHFFTKTSSRLCLHENNANDEIEVTANRFAAEFLLPEETLKRRIADEFGVYYSLESIKLQTLLRFIARLHCTWYLPYRSLVRRLKEIEAITKKQYEELYDIDERDPKGGFYRIGESIQRDVFIKLNTITEAVGTSAHAIETIVRNFEHGVIDEQTFADTLALFNRNPADFGYEISVSQDTIDEIDDLIRGWESES
jgi:Zn-dependent peptidase ImmA (M78 family)